MEKPQEAASDLKAGSVVKGSKFFDFPTALYHIMYGLKVSRAVWNSESVFLFLLPSGDVPKEKLQDPALKKVASTLPDDTIPCEPSIRMLTPQGTILTGWLPSHVDLFAKDWYLVGEEESSSK